MLQYPRVYLLERKCNKEILYFNERRLRERCCKRSDQTTTRYYKYAINKLGLWQRIQKNGMFMCRKSSSQFWDLLTVLLEDPEYEKFIGMVLILKGTYFGKVDFINTFLMDFCLLL